MQLGSLLNQHRKTKKELDNISFYGNILDVGYYPDAETYEETKQKLDERIHLIKNYKKKYIDKIKEPIKVEAVPDLLSTNRAFRLTAKRKPNETKLFQPILSKRKKHLDV